MVQTKELKGLLSRAKVNQMAQVFERATPVDVPLGKKVEFMDDQNPTGVALESEGKKYALAPDALYGISKEVGIPVQYVHKTPPGLMLPHLNYWYREKMEGKVIRLLSVEGVAVAMTTKSHVDYVKLSDVMNLIEKKLGPKNIAGYHKVSLTWDHSVFSVVEKRSFSVVKDDLLNSGIRFEHSLMGVAPTKVSAYVYRQVCSNGAIGMDEIESWSRRNRAGALSDWLTVVAKEAKKAFEREGERLKRLREIKTEKNTSVILNNIMVEDGIPKKLRKEVRDAALDANVGNLYDLYNVLAQVSTYSTFFEKHPNARALLEGAAGNLTRHAKLCPSCHRRVKKV